MSRTRCDALLREVRDFNLYRCELGFARIKRHTNKKERTSETIEYVQVTHREYWVYDDGTIKEVTPHTLTGKPEESP